MPVPGIRRSSQKKANQKSISTVLRMPAQDSSTRPYYKEVLIMARKIKNTVGKGKENINDPRDVAIVQDLLNLVPVASGGPYDWIKVDGIYGKQTEDAIYGFQKNAAGFKWPDCIVSPGAKTMLTLNGFERAAGTSFQISRWESNSVVSRNGTEIDMFYSIRNVKNGYTGMYWFGASGTKPPGCIKTMRCS
jgi:hypothetical protein